jgi:ABC-type microcin C transport system duplicated ATPase subunit YejF
VKVYAGPQVDAVVHVVAGAALERSPGEVLQGWAHAFGGGQGQRIAIARALVINLRRIVAARSRQRCLSACRRRS